MQDGPCESELLPVCARPVPCDPPVGKPAHCPRVAHHGSHRQAHQRAAIRPDPASMRVLHTTHHDVAETNGCRPDQGRRQARSRDTSPTVGVAVSLAPTRAKAREIG